MSQHQRYIAIVTETFPPEINGVANTLSQLCQGLIKRKYSVSVVRPTQRYERRPASDSRTASPQNSDNQIIVRGLPLPGCPELRFGLVRPNRLIRLWTHHRPDVIYVATEGPLGLAAVCAARRLNIPICSGFHTNFHRYSKHYGVAFLCRLITGYLRWFHNLTDLTLVPTRAMKQTVQQMGIRDCAIWGRGVDCEHFTPHKRDAGLRREWGLSERDLAVLYVGRLAPEKNLSMVVSCFERLRYIHSRAKLVFVGDGPMREQLAESHPDYIFCGTRQGEALARHYACGDLFLFPSQTETFGNVVAEAMASGLAVVAFDDAAARELIRHEDNGMKVPVTDAGAFVASALNLADQPSVAGCVRRQARLDALELHWPSLIEQFEKIIATLTPREHAHVNKQGVSFL